jgi:hypothetical protein
MSAPFKDRFAVSCNVPSYKPLIAVGGDNRSHGGGTREFNDRRLGGDVAPDGNISRRMVAASSFEKNV